MLVTGGGSGIGAAIVARLRRPRARRSPSSTSTPQASEKLVAELAGAAHRAAVHPLRPDRHRRASRCGRRIRHRARAGRACSSTMPRTTPRSRSPTSRPTPGTSAMNAEPQAPVLRRAGGASAHAGARLWLDRQLLLDRLDVRRRGFRRLLDREGRRRRPYQRARRANSAPTTSASTRIAPGAVHTERQLRLWYTKEQADEFASRPASHHWLLADEIARTDAVPRGRRQPDDHQAILIVDAGCADASAVTIGRGQTCSTSD